MGKIFSNLTNTQSSPGTPGMDVSRPSSPTFTAQPDSSVPFGPQLGGLDNTDPGASAPMMSTPSGMQMPRVGAQPGVSNTPSFFQAARTGPGGTPNALSPALSTKGKLLTVLLAAARGGLAGEAGNAQTYAATGRNAGFGGGAAAGMQLPYTMAENEQGAERGGLENQQLRTGMQMIPVSGPGGRQFNIPQSAVPGFLGTTTRVEGMNTRSSNRNDTQSDIATQRTDAQMAKVGMKPDPDNPGSYIRMSPEEMPAGVLSRVELNDAHENYYKAQGDLATAKASGDQKRIKIAQQNANTAASTLQLKQRQFSVNTYGTDNGEAVPGGASDASGNPIGSTSPGAKIQEHIAVQSAKGPAKGYTRIQDHTGRLHDIPSVNLEAARQRDPGLKVITAAY